MPQSLLNILSAKHPTSGEDLARQFGCSRAAIAKRIAFLREGGVLINASPRIGYQFDYEYQWWTPDKVSSLFQSQALVCHCLPRVDSTNTWMRSCLSQSKIDAMHIAVTDFQEAGQGRRGRSWQGFPGRQYTASIGYVSTLAPVAWVGVALAVGVCIASVLRKHGWPVKLKWPNDLCLEDAKLGGILVEMDAMAEGPSRIIIGFAINEQILKKEKEALNRPVACLRDSDAHYDRYDLLEEIVVGLADMLRGYGKSGLQPWQTLWQEYDALCGRAVAFESDGKWQEGVARGIDDQGALLIETERELIKCHSGEVTVRAKP